jgi:hypothetical protein
MSARHLTLGQLIAALEPEDPDLVIPLGFRNPHSYRGIYSEVAFEVAHNIRVGDMLDAARSALGETYQGWKGGDFTMEQYTDCYLVDDEGCTGESIGSTLLRFMLDAGKGTSL